MALLDFVDWDSETSLIRPGVPAPELVCVSLWGEESQPVLLNPVDGLQRLWDSRGRPWCGHNLMYDLRVIIQAEPAFTEPVFEKLDRGEIFDTQLAAQLSDIAAGCFRWLRKPDGTKERRNYSLNDLAQRYLNKYLSKGADSWRLHYWHLRNIPLDQWPHEARHYALEDAATTRQVRRVIQSQWRDGKVVDLENQCKSAFWRGLTSSHGIRTNEAAVDKFEAEIETRIEKLIAPARAAGFFRKNGSVDTKRVAAAFEADWAWQIAEGRRPSTDTPPRTPTGKVSITGDTCQESEDPAVLAYGEFLSLRKVIKADVPLLRSGSIVPIHTRFDIADTGRSTSSGPNIQNVSKFPGVRECFQPRPGCVYLQGDYPGIELSTFAEVLYELFGRSSLGEAILAGRDCHVNIAATFARMPYEEAYAAFKNKLHPMHTRIKNDYRQLGKVANFGIPGGLGDKRLIVFAAGDPYNVTLDEHSAKELRKIYYETVREVPEYFKLISEICRGPNPTISQIYTGRIRGGLRYTQACNGYFQALAADVAGEAGWRIAKACYLPSLGSPLLGSRIVNFVHDEFILETPNENLDAKARALSELMVGGANHYLRKVPFKSIEIVAMRRWIKGADPMYNQRGELIPVN